MKKGKKEKQRVTMTRRDAKNRYEDERDYTERKKKKLTKKNNKTGEKCYGE